MSRFSHHNLTAVFYRTSNTANPCRNISGIWISEPLYALYINLYQASLAFAKALQNVLDDGEHRLVMQEASEIGYHLPDMDLFQDDLSAFTEFLKSFNPYDVELRGRGDIKIPYKTARNLHAMVHYDCVMVSKTLSACFETEYLKYFKVLKGMNIPYTGSSALQEMQDVLTCMTRNRMAHDRQAERETMPERKEWPALLV